MFYSAQIKEDFRKFLRDTRSKMDLETVVRIYWERRESTTVKIPKAINAEFLRGDAQTEQGKEIQRLICEYYAAQVTKLEQDVFKQKKRQADAERTLQTKTTKKAQEDLRISTSKIEANLRRIGDIKRTEPKDGDARIFPGWFAPVLVSEGGHRLVKLVRYQ